MDGSRSFGDAISYITYVKKALVAEPEKYQEFLKILTDLRANGLDTSNAILRMEKVLKDHHKQLLGFVKFLPPYAKINIPPEATTTYSFSYILSVKEAFRVRPEDYDAFVQLLRDHTAHKLDVDTFTAQVEVLMKDHQNLLLGFIFHLPEDQRTISPEAEQQVANFLGKLKGSDLHVSFREILEKFKQTGQSLKEVHEEVVELVQGQDDLVMELFEFSVGVP